MVMGFRDFVDTSYVSDHTRFINEQLEKNPEWQDTQKSGRDIWWDKKVDADEQRRQAESKVPQKSYPYDITI